MFSVPSVTMNGGSRTRVTSTPVTTPKPTQVRIPRAIACSGGTPLATASFAMMIWPSAITVPTERSMPAVRMISVWPIASTPDDHHLLEHERQVLGLEEAVGLQREERHREH